MSVPARSSWSKITHVCPWKGKKKTLTVLKESCSDSEVMLNKNITLKKVHEMTIKSWPVSTLSPFCVTNLLLCTVCKTRKCWFSLNISERTITGPWQEFAKFFSWGLSPSDAFASSVCVSGLLFSHSPSTGPAKTLDCTCVHCSRHGNTSRVCSSLSPRHGWTRNSNLSACYVADQILFCRGCCRC